MSFETNSVVFPDSYGFCEGVAAADHLLEKVAIDAKANGIEVVYGLHEIVHNKDVVAKHEANGVRFVETIEEIPDGSVVVTSAHGVGPEVIHKLEQKESIVFDAACPLVLHTHRGVALAREADEKVIYVCHGKPGEVAKLHDEVAGMVGHLDFAKRDGQLFHEPVDRNFLELNEDLNEGNDLLSEAGKYRIISQTTLHAQGCLTYREEIKQFILEHQPGAQVSWSSPGEVCFAVSDRQAGVEQLIQLRPRRIVVATDPGSKNGMGYVALAKQRVAEGGLDTEVIAVANAEQAQALDPIDGITGLTASASTPDETTFAIAGELGLTEIPSLERRMFTLAATRDPALIPKAIAAHALMFANKGGN